MTDLGRFDDAWLFEFRRKSAITDEAAMKCLQRDLQDVGKHYRRIIETTSCDLKGIRRERQMVGIAKAKVAGVYKGRKPSVPADTVRQLRADGVGPSEIAKRLGFGRASVYRVLAEV